jgi:hypothetical protein
MTTNSRKNLAIGVQMLARAKSGDRKAVEWIRDFMFRVTDPTSNVPLETPCLLDLFDVMLDFHREWIDDRLRMN